MCEEIIASRGMLLFEILGRFILYTRISALPKRDPVLEVIMAH